MPSLLNLSKIAFAVVLIQLAASSAKASPGNALDRIDFGNTTSEGVHSFEPNYAQKDMPLSGTGALGQTYRQCVGNSTNYATGSVDLVFTMAVDPARQNYITVRTWGSEIPGGQMYLLGAPSTYEAIELDGGNPPLPNRFAYYTVPIPIAWTTGKSSLQITIWFAHYFDRYFGTGTNYLSDGQLAQKVYSAYTHTDPFFVPNSSDPTGTQPTLTATPTLAALNAAKAVGTTAAPGLLMTTRKSIFGTGGELATILARQAIVLNGDGTWSPPSGAPKEVAGLDMFTALAGWVSSNPGASADTWRNRIANQKAGPGYTAFPDELISVLTTAYLTPKITDSNGAVVTTAGYDDYHDATLIPRLVAAMDGASYEQDSDGGFIQQGSEWTGLTSSARTTGSFIGATSREPTVHGGGDLQGIDTYALGWSIINLLNDPTAAPLFQNYLGQTYDADLNGGSTLRATAYERMLYNAVNWYSYGTGGTESQNMFQMVAMYASSIALQKLQVLYPNSAYVVNPANYPAGNWLQSTSTPLQAAKMIMGLIPDTLRGPYQAGYTNYGMSVAGLGEADGVLSCGFDGGYGQMLPWISPRIAWLSTFDSSAAASDVAAFQSKARAAITAYDQILYPQESATLDANGNVTQDVPTVAADNFTAYRNVENPNWDAGTYNFNPQFTASDPSGGMNSAYALRSAYLQTQYSQTPAIADSTNSSLNYLKDLAPYESTVLSLVGVNPSTLTPLPGEPGQGDFTWADVQVGAVSFAHNGERIFLNSNWRNVTFNGSVSQTDNVARIVDIALTTLHAGWLYMPVNSATVQSDGNLSGTYGAAWVVRYGNYLIVINQGAAAFGAKLPAGYGQAQDLVTKNFYNLGTSVSVAAGNYAIFALNASTSETSSASSPAFTTAATASSATVTGTTASLSALATANNGDTESNLTYTWSLAGNPPDPVTFSANGTNAAKSTTVTFAAAGTYTFNVVATDGTNGLSASSSTAVTVTQTLSGLTISPATTTLYGGQTLQFPGTSYDQFGAPMQTPQTVTWLLTSGTGTLDTFGHFTAPTGVAESDTVKATVGAFSTTATATVLPPVGIFGGALDIGSPALAGSSSFTSPTTYTVKGEGKDIWSTSDQFQFSNLLLTGDGIITARVVSESSTLTNAKAGVMFRNTLDANSAYALAMVLPNSPKVSLQYRSAAAGSAAGSGSTTTAAFPYWVRLARAGNTFTAYSSPDGTSWAQLGNVQTISMNATVYVGLAVTSISTTTLNTAVFDNVSVVQPKNVLFTNQADVGGATPFGTYAETGTLAVSGTTSSLSGTATMTAGGTNITGTTDSFSYAYVPISGDTTVTARVASMTSTLGSAKAGVMIRNTLDPASAEASLVLSPTGPVRFQQRLTAGATTGGGKVDGVGALSWVRLVRSGNSFTASYSANGTTWTQLGSAATIVMNNTVYVGLATTSIVSGTATTVTYDNISLTGTLDAAPTIATTAFAGSSSITGTSTTLSVLGTDSDGGGESNLTYTWTPLGETPAPVTFSANGTNAAKSTTVTFTASGTYYFQVTITDTGGDSVTSGIVAVTVNLGAPTNLAAIVGGNQVTLNWTPSTFATSYNVLRSTTSGSGYTTLATGVTANTYTDTGLTGSATYYYVVTAVDSLGNAANSTELEMLASPATIAGFTPAGDILVLNQSGTIAYTNSTGTAASSVTRASGITYFGGALTGARGRNFTITGTSTNTNDLFGPLVLSAGGFYGGVTAGTANATVTFSSLTRNPGTQLNFYDLYTVPFGTNTITSQTAANVNVAFTTSPSLMGGGGATGSPTISVLPYANVGGNLATYDVNNGVRALNTSTEMATFVASGMTASTVAKITGNLTLTASESVNALQGVTSGTITLGNNTLTVASGSFVANNSETIGASVNDGTLAFGSAEGNLFVPNNRALVINSVITGSNGLTIGIDDGNGTNSYAILAGANTYTGVTTLLGNNVALQLRLTNSLALQNTTLDYNNYGASIAFGNGGTTGLTAYTFGGLKGAQNLALTSNNTAPAAVALTIGNDGDSTTYSGILSGAGSVIKTGAGALTLTGANTYTGSTIINQGALQINGSTAAASAVSVNYGGALGGSGTVNGATIVGNGGSIAPGNGGVSTLTFSGGLNLNAGCALTFDLGTTPASDKIALTGAYTAPANGVAMIDINAVNGFGMGVYTLMTGATNVSASSFLIGDAPGGYGYTLISSGSSLLLVVGPFVTPPAAPTALAATVGNNQVSLSWTTASAATNYTVLRSNTSGSGYVPIAAGITATSYVDATTLDGTAYYYVVEAENAGGPSVTSTEIAATPIAPPAAPTGLVATAGDAQVGLSWTASTGAASYNVLRSTTSGSGYVSVVSGITTTSYSDSGVTNGTNFYYVITSTNAAGTSANSAEVGALPLPPIPAAPSGLLAIAGDSQVSLSWATSTGAASYNVLRSTTSGSGYVSVATGLTTPGYSDSGLSDGTTYFYVVTATNLGGTSPNSAAASALPLPPAPAAPTALIATAGNAQVGLTWTASSGAASYTVLRSTTNGSGYVGVASSLTTAAYTDSSLTNGTTFFYVVQAVNLGGTSPSSVQASATPLPPIPTAPIGLVATAGNTQVGLTWTASSGAASYNVLRSTTSGSGYLIVANSLTTPAYTDSSLTNGTAYYYVVQAVNLGGTSSNSAQASATPVPPIPAAPIGLVATVGNAQVGITWTASTGAASYNVLRSTTSGSGYVSVANSLTTPAYTDSSLTNGTTYYYVVQAVNLGGTSPNSAQASATPLPSIPDAPTGLVATTGNAQIGLTWTASSGATSYNVLRSTTNGSGYVSVANSLTSPSYTDGSVTNGTAYYYVVQAVNLGGTSPNSAQASATPLPPIPAAPIGLVATAGNAQVDLTWTASSGAASYNVLRSTTSGSGYVGVATALTAPSYTDGNLTNGTPYYYVVQAVNLGGTSPSSAQASATPLPSIPAAPIGLIATTGNAQVGLVWTASSGAVSYNVLRSTTTGSGYVSLASGLTALSYTDGGLTNGTTYYYVVQAVNLGGTSPSSAQASATPLPSIPAAPTGLVATAGNAQVGLIWTASSGAASYNVLRSTTSGSGYASVATGVTTMSYTNTSLTNGTTYYYVVQAVNTGGSSVNSAQASATPAATLAAPTNLVATAGSAQVVLTWTAASGAKTYSVSRSTTNGSGYTSIKTGNVSTSYTNTGLTNGTTYYYVVQAVYTGGTSANSAQASATPVLLAPTNLAATAGNAQVGLKWTASTGAATYNVLRSTVSGSGYAVIKTGNTSTTYTNTGLTNGTTYYYVVQAVNTGGTSANSAQASATPVPPIAAAPTTLAATAGNAQVGLTWKASSGATSYTVLRSTTSGSGYASVASGITLTSYTDSGLTNGTTYYYVVEAVNLGGASGNSNQASATPASAPIVDSWMDNDIGSVGPAGGATYSAGVFTLNGSGLGIAGTADGFEYTYQTLVGDGTIIARVATQSAGESGVAIRGSLDPNALMVSMLLQNGVGAKFQYRTTIGSSVALGGTVSSLATPYWVRLARVGDVFTGYTSPDGATWTQVGQITNAMTGTIYVGLAQSSMSTTTLATGTFDNVAIVPAPIWSSQDIGTVPFVGASYYSGGVATIHGAGSDIFGTADQFRFTYTTASGDCDITARVTSETNTNAAAKAGVMIRADLTAGAANVGMYLLPGKGVSSEWRTTAKTSSASTTIAGFATPYWMRVTRVGTTFTSYRSPDGVTWTKIGSETITMPTNVYIGLPVCSHSTTVICTGVFDNITVDP